MVYAIENVHTFLFIQKAKLSTADYIVFHSNIFSTNFSGVEVIKRRGIGVWTVGVKDGLKQETVKMDVT